jgi:fibronectin type 3 domain-containing protein
MILQSSNIKIYFICLFLFPSILFGQAIVLDKSVNDSNFPEITWRTTGRIDSTDFKVFRAGASENIFTEIHTIHFEKPIYTGDTSAFVIVDTTLTSKGLYLYYIQVMRNNRAVKSETAHGHNFGLLPEPRLTSFKATPLEDRKAVRLDWTFNYRETINSMSLYRSSNYDSSYVKVAELDADMTSFEDVIPVANEPWFYYMVVHDYFGNQLPGVRIPAFATFAEKPFRPNNIHGEFKNDSIVLDWTNPAKNSVGYRVYRSIEGKQFRLMNELNQSLAENAIFIDNSPEIKSTTRLAYFVRNVSDGFLESNSSDTMSFYIPEHEKVLPPAELDFIKEQNTNIRLLWTPPSEGLALGYNVYISSPEGRTQKLNTEVLRENHFVDTVFRAEGKYLYAIESVGYANKVSERRINTTVYYYPPNIHVIVDLKKRTDGLEISWKKPLADNITKVLLYKKSDQNPAVLTKSYPPEEDVVYLDTKVSSGNTYLYTLVAVMADHSEVVLNDGVEMFW